MSIERNDLIGRVAVGYLAQCFEREETGNLRFCMVGFDPALVSPIAAAVLGSALATQMAVRIPSELADPDLLPPSVVSGEAAAHWRNRPIPEPGKRAILFAVGSDELQRIGKTAETLPKLRPESLRDATDLWLGALGLAGDELAEKERTTLAAALNGLNRSHLARTITGFADYALATERAIREAGRPVPAALDDALPALHLPREAGAFQDLSEAKRKTPRDWQRLFERLRSDIRPYLDRQTPGRETIDRDVLRNNLESLLDDLLPAEIEIARNFIEAPVSPDSWTSEQAALTELAWPSIGRLFEGTTKNRPSATLGQQTIQYLDDEYEGELDEHERDLLTRKASPPRPSQKLDEELQEFFAERREQLASNRALCTKWERLVYRNPDESEDFLELLIGTLERLYRLAEADDRHLRIEIRIPNAGSKSFWERKNKALMGYFARRYYGIEHLFDGTVNFDFGRLGRYFTSGAADFEATDSSRRDACELKFEGLLKAGEEELARTVFSWRFAPGSVPLALPRDLDFLANSNGDRALLSVPCVTRQPLSAKGQVLRLDLHNANTIRDVKERNEGAFVHPDVPGCDREVPWRQALETLRDDGILSDEAAERLRLSFEQFVQAYTRAIRAWTGQEGRGIADPHMLEQVEAYGDLLGQLRDLGNSDRVKEALWRPLLQLGCAIVEGGQPALVVTPWHPLRLAEIHVKAAQTASLFADVLGGDRGDAYAADLFFAQRRKEVVSVYYPEVALGAERCRVPFVVTDQAGDYLLAEPAISETGNGSAILDIDPKHAANALNLVAENYLSLLPHESSNFSVMLYNAESKELPKTVASRLADKVEQDAGLSCELLLSHQDPKRMRWTYEQQNMAVHDETSTMGPARDHARHFLSRLRVGFLDEGDQKGTSAPINLIFLQDVVARNAALDWFPTTSATTRPMLDLQPTRWSRRRPIRQGDRRGIVYLTAPVQPRAGQNYLNAIHAMLDRNADSDADMLPARVVDFGNQEIRELFERTHRLGEWVINFDELADRRLIEEAAGIRVIRHIHDRDAARNLVISTGSEGELLRTLLIRRLQRLGVVPKVEETALAARLIARALDLSGQIVMRAARYGQYANELIGVVLSMERMKRSLEAPEDRIGWFFLDDYASWFGLKEDHIADVLAIAPGLDAEGAPLLSLVIAEAKFVGSANAREQANKSKKQLHATVNRITRALDPDCSRIDRGMWLHRIGDLMLQRMRPFEGVADEPYNCLEEWSEAVRDDRVAIRVLGFSHIFVHDEEETLTLPRGRSPIGRREEASVQEVLDQAAVCAELRRFADRSAAPEPADLDPRTAWEDSLRSRPDGATAPASRTIEPPPTVGAAPSQRLEPAAAPPAPPSTPADKLDLVAAPKSQMVDEAAYTRSGRAWDSAEFHEWIERNAERDSTDCDGINAWLEDAVPRLRRALRGYDMSADLVDDAAAVRLTPNAALVRFKGSDRLTVKRVEQKLLELQTSHALKVIDVQPSIGEVVVLVERPNRAVLALPRLWRDRAAPPPPDMPNTSLVVGERERDGRIFYLNIAGDFAGQPQHSPHSLISGTTGSGKSVLVQNLLLEICATNTTRLARIHLIDPKHGLDYPWMERMPHLEGGVVTQTDTAREILRHLVQEMHARYLKMRAVGSNNLTGYNRKVEPAERLPVIWLVHDEFAEWMLDSEYREAVTTSVSQLGIMARAAGIHLVFIAQRPDNTVFPMQLRTNLGNRLILRVEDEGTAKIALGETGAERLLGKGHIAAKLGGEHGPILGQVPFLEMARIDEVAAIIAKCTS